MDTVMHILPSLEFWEFMSYLVTVVGLPLAIGVFVFQQRKERRNEESALFEALSDNYQDFLHVVLENPDLRLFSANKTPQLSAEQRERMMIIFSMLISLFERAYLVVYENRLSGAKLRRWSSWQDYMLEWCEREDFRDALENQLVGEDPEFSAYIRALAARFSQGAAAGSVAAGR